MTRPHDITVIYDFLQTGLFIKYTSVCFLIKPGCKHSNPGWQHKKAG
jgi:hypothetical protein